MRRVSTHEQSTHERQTIEVNSSEQQTYGIANSREGSLELARRWLRKTTIKISNHLLNHWVLLNNVMDDAYAKLCSFQRTIVVSVTPQKSDSASKNSTGSMRKKTCSGDMRTI